MVLWILLMWIGLSIISALTVGKFIASVNRRGQVADTPWCLENPSGLMEDPYTNQVESGELANQAVAL